MAEKIVMLALSPTMEKGTIIKWLKKEGDHISNGDVLCEVETDKATMDYESNWDGDLLKIVADSGSKVEVGDLIAIIGKAGENIESLLLSGGVHKGVEKKQPPVSELRVSEEAKETNISAKERIRASPLAKEIARQKGIDLHTVIGSGPQGRIVKQDVEKIGVKGGPQIEKITPYQKRITISQEQEIAISEKRKVIAKRLSESIFTAPHYYLTIVTTVENLLSARKNLNMQTDLKISFNAFIIKFVAEALKRHPVVNSSWKGNTIVYHKSIDIGIAVAQSDGLITPVVRNCAEKGIMTIDSELKGLIEKAQQGKLQYDEYNNAYFTISNLGSYGVRNFTAIINPPGSAILAVGEVYREPYEDEKGIIKFRNCIEMTLSCDHRVIDGAVAAAFGKDLKNIIENPISILY